MSNSTNHLQINERVKSTTETLEKLRPELIKVIPSHMCVDKLLRNIKSCLRDNPSLTNCDKMSICRAAFTAANLGLEMEPIFGQCYIVPFKGKAQLIIGYKGYIALAFNSGIMLKAVTVREHDDFYYEEGLNPILKHVPAKKERGDIVYAYAIARNKQLGDDFVVIDSETLNARKQKAITSNRYYNGPWNTDYQAMCEKTAIRTIASRLPGTVFKKIVELDYGYEKNKHTYIDLSGDVVTQEIDEIKRSENQPTFSEIIGDNNE